MDTTEPQAIPLPLPLRALFSLSSAGCKAISIKDMRSVWNVVWPMGKSGENIALVYLTMLASSLALSLQPIEDGTIPA